MKNKILIICVLLVLAGVGLFLADRNKNARIPNDEVGTLSTKTEKADLPLQVPENNAKTREAYIAQVRLDMKNISNYRATRPMALKGKVVDEEGTALQGAKVEATWLYLSETQSIERKYLTDQDGYFEINDSDAIGKMLSIQEIELEGYTWVKGGG